MDGEVGKVKDFSADGLVFLDGVDVNVVLTIQGQKLILRTVETDISNSILYCNSSRNGK